MEIIRLFVDPIVKVLPVLPGAIINLAIGLILIKIAMILIRRGVKILKIPHDLRGIIITLSKLFMWLFLVIFIVSQLGLGNLAVLISGSAVVLVFFLNTTAGPLLSDIFSGLFLVSDPDFTIGMRVSVNDGKTEGVIKGIDMRKVRILDEKDKLHIVPNSLIEKGEWVVLERKAK